MSDDDELARLRRRAYGPDADIDRDPAARARLDELEGRLRAERATPAQTPMPPPVPELLASIALVTGVPPHLGAAPSPEPVDDVDAAGGAASSVADGGRSTRRTLVAACAVTALATLAVAVPVTLGAAALLDRPAAVLTPADAPATASYLDFNFEEGSRNYDAFYGLHIAVGTFEGSTDTCLLVRVNAEKGTGACSPRGLEPTCDLAARDASPLIRDRFGDDAVLRFAVSGDDVQIFVVHPEPIDAPADDA